MDFNKLNEQLYQESVPHKFAKAPNNIDKGYLKISNWVADLCYFYEQKRIALDKSDEAEFKVLIAEHRKKIGELDDSDYKIGLLKAINEVEKH